ncbi:DUF998 domain-containing protein [Nakamurella sp. GG22]
MSTTSMAVDCRPEDRITRSLLGYGIIAGPFYVVVSLAQAAVRDGFDLTRHECSLLANGSAGWVQVVNLIVTGLMVLAAAAGYRRALGAGVGRRSAPILLGVFGAGLVGAGVFRADPMNGFPVGIPDGPPLEPTIAGTLHLAFAGVGFLALIAAALLLAVRFSRQGRRTRAVSSAIAGLALLAGFAALASGSTSAVINLAFTAAVLFVWAWLSSTSLLLYRQQS